MDPDEVWIDELLNYNNIQSIPTQTVGISSYNETSIQQIGNSTSLFENTPTTVSTPETETVYSNGFNFIAGQTQLPDCAQESPLFGMTMPKEDDPESVMAIDPSLNEPPQSNYLDNNPLANYVDPNCYASVPFMDVNMSCSQSVMFSGSSAFPSNSTSELSYSNFHGSENSCLSYDPQTMSPSTGISFDAREYMGSSSVHYDAPLPSVTDITPTPVPQPNYVNKSTSNFQRRKSNSSSIVPVAHNSSKYNADRNSKIQSRKTNAQTRSRYNLQNGLTTPNNEAVYSVIEPQLYERGVVYTTPDGRILKPTGRFVSAFPNPNSRSKRDIGLPLVSPKIVRMRAYSPRNNNNPIATIVNATSWHDVGRNRKPNDWTYGFRTVPDSVFAEMPILLPKKPPTIKTGPVQSRSVPSKINQDMNCAKNLIDLKSVARLCEKYNPNNYPSEIKSSQCQKEVSVKRHGEYCEIIETIENEREVFPGPMSIEDRIADEHNYGKVLYYGLSRDNVYKVPNQPTIHAYRSPSSRVNLETAEAEKMKKQVAAATDSAIRRIGTEPGWKLMNGWLKGSYEKRHTKHLLKLLRQCYQAAVPFELLVDTTVDTPRFVKKLVKIGESPEVRSFARSLVEKWTNIVTRIANQKRQERLDIKKRTREQATRDSGAHNVKDNTASTSNSEEVINISEDESPSVYDMFALPPLNTTADERSRRVHKAKVYMSKGRSTGLVEDTTFALNNSAVISEKNKRTMGNLQMHSNVNNSDDYREEYLSPASGPDPTKPLSFMDAILGQVEQKTKKISKEKAHSSPRNAENGADKEEKRLDAKNGVDVAASIRTNANEISDGCVVKEPIKVTLNGLFSSISANIGEEYSQPIDVSENTHDLSGDSSTNEPSSCTAASPTIPGVKGKFWRLYEVSDRCVSMEEKCMLRSEEKITEANRQETVQPRGECSPILPPSCLSDECAAPDHIPVLIPLVSVTDSVSPCVDTSPSCEIASTNSKISNHSEILIGDVAGGHAWSIPLIEMRDEQEQADPQPGPAPVLSSTRVCKFYHTQKGCAYGVKCRFLHGGSRPLPLGPPAVKVSGNKIKEYRV